MRIIYIFLLLFYLSNLHAQQEVAKGRIITHKLDTIDGYIAKESYISHHQLCKFKKNETSEFVIYKPEDIQGYWIEDSKYYISKNLNHDKKDTALFLEFLVEGKLNLYSIYNRQFETFYIQKDNDSLVYIDSRKLYFNYDEKQKKYVETENKSSAQYIKEGRSKGILKSYFRGIPELQNHIDRMQINTNAMVSLSSKYHDLTCEGSACIVYQKVAKPKIRLGLTSGYSFNSYTNYYSFSDDPLIDETFNKIGIYGTYQFLRWSENVFLRIELYSTEFSTLIIEENDGYQLEASGIVLPVSIQYDFPISNHVKPIVAGGITLQKLNATFNKYEVRDYRVLRYFEEPETSSKYENLKYGLSGIAGMSFCYKKLNFEVGVFYATYIKEDHTNSFKLFAGLSYQLR